MLGPDGKPLKGPNGEYIYPPPYGAPLEQGGVPGGPPGGLPTQTPGAAKPREYIVDFSLNSLVDPLPVYSPKLCFATFLKNLLTM